MTGAESIRLRQSGGPVSTGQVPSWAQAAISAAAHSGGSVIDRNVPPPIPIRMCAEISAYGRASGRLAGRGRRLGAVLHPDPEPQRAVGARDPLGPDIQHPVQP